MSRSRARRRATFGLAVVVGGGALIWLLLRLPSEVFWLAPLLATMVAGPYLILAVGAEASSRLWAVALIVVSSARASR